MTTPLLIGLGHKKQSGKDTFAKFLKDHLSGYTWTTAFALPLKMQVAAACGISLEELEQNKAIFRPILQWWGTEFRRKYQKNDNYWINEMEKCYQEVSCKNFIITDCRFRNEATYIKAKGGILINVRRTTGELDSHGSECDLDQYEHWDYNVNNDGSLEELEKQAKYIASKIISLKESP